MSTILKALRQLEAKQADAEAQPPTSRETAVDTGVGPPVHRRKTSRKPLWLGLGLAFAGAALVTVAVLSEIAGPNPARPVARGPAQQPAAPEELTLESPRPLAVPPSLEIASSAPTSERSVEPRARDAADPGRSSDPRLPNSAPPARREPVAVPVVAEAAGERVAAVPVVAEPVRKSAVAVPVVAEAAGERAVAVPVVAEAAGERAFVAPAVVAARATPKLASPRRSPDLAREARAPAVDAPTASPTPRKAVRAATVDRVAVAGSPLVPPLLGLERTRWHPLSERREANVVIDGVGIVLREGDDALGYTLLEITPSSIVFGLAGETVRVRVGSNRDEAE